MCCEIKEKSNTIKYNPLFELLKYVYSFFSLSVWSTTHFFQKLTNINA